MITLVIRTVLIYLLVFTVMRLMGKRQLNDMQPFDLVVTLLIAEAASEPISDSGIPLFYGVVTILVLFILHTAVSFVSMKSHKVRDIVCGKPVYVIANGEVIEDALRAANYTLSDLTEQLRMKDVFSISEAAYGILETNGSLSVLKKDGNGKAQPSVMLVSDGEPRSKALAAVGWDEKKLEMELKKKGLGKASECLYVCLEPDGTLTAQRKQWRRGKRNA